MSLTAMVQKLFHHLDKVKWDSKVTILVIEEKPISREAQEAKRKLDAFRSAMYRWSDLRGYGDKKPLDGLVLATYENRALPHLKELEMRYWELRHSA